MQFGFGLGLTHLRPASVNADPIAGLYGTGMEQVPLHLRAEDAVLDGGGNVTTVANRGGAGELFNAIAGGAPIKRTDKLLNIAAVSAWLDLQYPADLDGTRLFMVARRQGTAWRFFASMEGGVEGDGNQANDRRIQETITSGTSRIRLYPSTSAGFEDSMPFPSPTGLTIYEIEKVGTALSVWINGSFAGVSNHSTLAGPFLLRRLLATQVGSSADWVGDVGDILSVVTDGTAARDGTMLDVRRALASKHGITLP